MKVIKNQESIKILEEVFEENNIYHFSDYPYQALCADASVQDFEKEMVNLKWLFDQDGFYNRLPHFRTFQNRLIEFKSTEDYLHSLRQRLNITHELIECNFKSNLPVHISIVPREDKEEYTLDLTNIESLKQFTFIIHPGQTRAQGAVFFRKSLKNVMLYSLKKYNIKVSTNLACEKITQIGRLLDFYIPYSKDGSDISNESFAYDFYIPHIRMKEHVHGKKASVKILKADSIRSKNNSGHPSSWYISKSFTSSNKFFNILFNNKFKIYTTNSQLAKTNQYKVFNKNISKFLGTADPNLIIRFIYYFRIDSIERYNQPSTWMKNVRVENRYDLFNLELNELEKVFMKNEREIENELVEQQQQIFPSKEYIECKQNFELTSIPKLNKFRGFSIFNRLDKYVPTIDYYELLFCIPANVTMSKNKTESLVIINNEHPYWQTGNNYSEFIINDDFLTRI